MSAALFFEDLCTAVCVRVRFKPGRGKIRHEPMDHLTDHREVLGVAEKDLWGRTYAVRWEEWYGPVRVSHNGFFWDTGAVTAVENDPGAPLVSTTPNGEFRFSYNPICVFSNGQDTPAGNCFVPEPTAPEYSSCQYNGHYRLSGYDAGGELVWRSPTPVERAEEFSIRVNS